VSALSAPPTEVVRDYGGRVAVERPDDVPAGYVLEGQLGDVGVRLKGTEAALANVVPSDLHARLDVPTADLHRSDPQDVLVSVDVATAGVKVDSIAPATVTVRIEPITSRDVAVQARFANDPPTGTLAGDPAITPGQGRVSGAASQVARIAALYATVRFGDAVTDLVSSVQPTAVDASGATIEGLTVDPAVVQLTVPVLPTATTRTVPVVPALRGSVAAGYWITRVTSDPTVVTIRGESAALSAIDQVTTAALDVTGHLPGPRGRADARGHDGPERATDPSDAHHTNEVIRNRLTRLFGTDGVRGVANLDLTPELALRLGRAAGHVLGGPGHSVVIG